MKDKMDMKQKKQVTNRNLPRFIFVILFLTQLSSISPLMAKTFDVNRFDDSYDASSSDRQTAEEAAVSCPQVIESAFRLHFDWNGAGVQWLSIDAAQPLGWSVNPLR